MNAVSGSSQPNSINFFAGRSAANASWVIATTTTTSIISRRALNLSMPPPVDAIDHTIPPRQPQLSPRLGLFRFATKLRPFMASSTDFRPILPGSTIGVLGSGQLGRMFALAARKMGYRVHTLSPDNDTPTGQIADREIVADYDDLDRVREFAQGVDVVTVELGNVSSAATATCARFAPVRPAGQVLRTPQHRLREKTI